MGETTTTALTSALKTGLETVQSSVGSYVADALPIGLAIMGTLLAIRIAVGFFRSIAQ